MMTRMHRKAVLKAVVPLFLVIGIIIVLTVFLAQNGKFLAISAPIEFAGLTWQDSGHIAPVCGEGRESKSSVTVEGGVLTLHVDGFSREGGRFIETNIKGVDEILIVYDGNGQVNSAEDFSATVEMGALIRGSESGQIIQFDSITADRNDAFSTALEGGVWTFKDNFDGTWSTTKKIQDDLFRITSTQPIKGDPILRLYINGKGRACGGFQNQNNFAIYSYSGNMHIYNVIQKENSLAVCKADEILENGQCVQKEDFVLKNEEALKEGDAEKLQRIIDEQEQKIAGLEAQVQQAEELNQDTTVLEDEIDSAQVVLDAAVAGDKNIIAVVENDEQFEEPSKAKSFINRIITFIKGLFGG